MVCFVVFVPSDDDTNESNGGFFFQLKINSLEFPTRRQKYKIWHAIAICVIETSFSVQFSSRRFRFVFIFTIPMPNLKSGYVKSWSVPISYIAHSTYSACFACVMLVQFFRSFRSHTYGLENDHRQALLKTWYHHFELGIVCFAHSAILLLLAIANGWTKWNETILYLQLGAMRRGSLFCLRSDVRCAGSYEHRHLYRIHIHVNFLCAPQKRMKIRTNYQCISHNNLVQRKINFIRLNEQIFYLYL